MIRRQCRAPQQAHDLKHMTWPFKRRKPEQDPVAYYLSFRLLTGMGRLQAYSDEELSRLLGELRLAGASDITVVNHDGQLVTFDPGSK
jgi:hypothetical protein